MVLKCRTQLQATGADGSKRGRDRETPRPGLQPCKSPIKTRCCLKSEEAGLWNTALPKVLTWDLVLHGEAWSICIYKGFWQSRIQSAQAMPRRLPFSRHGTVSLPLRDVAGIRMSDDKSLGGNVRKWGFLRWKCSPCTLYLLQIEAAEGGIQPRGIYQRCPKRLISVWSGKGVQR